VGAINANKYKLNFAEIKRNAYGNWVSILESCGLSVTPKRGSTHVECPICGGTGCFRVDDKNINQTYICKCSAGDGFNLLQQSLNISTYEAFKRVNEIMGGCSDNSNYSHSAPATTSDTDIEPNTQPVSSKKKAFNAIKHTSSNTPTPQAIEYYKWRGMPNMGKVKIESIRYGDIHYLNKLIPREKPFKTSAIMGFMGFWNEKPLHIMQIYIDHTAIKTRLNKDKIENKKFLKTTKGNMNGTGVWFNSSANQVQHVSEGLENALSVCYALKTRNMVACGTGALLADVVIPDHVLELHVWADNDETGLKNAYKLADRYQNKDVIIHVPQPGLEPKKGNPDWNDLLIKDGGDTIRREFIENRI